MVFSLVACTSKSNIVGTWELVTEDDYIQKQMFEFKDDGTGLSLTMMNFDNDSSIAEFTWKIKSDTVVWKYNGEDSEREFKINSSGNYLYNGEKKFEKTK